MVSELFQCWILGPMMCNLSAFLQPVGVCASAYTLAVIAVEMYYAICEPLKCRNLNTKTRAVILLAGVWAFSFIANSISLLLFEHKQSISHWSCESEFPTSTMFYYQLYITLVLLFIPLTLITYLYGNVISSLNSTIENNDLAPNLNDKLPKEMTESITDRFLTVVKRRKISETFGYFRTAKSSVSSFTLIPSPSTSRLTFSDLTSSSSSVSLRRSNHERTLIARRKVTRMLTTIVVLFALCWTPSYVWWLVVRFRDAMGMPIWNSKLNTVLTLLTYISSCTNPLTYCFMNKSFRMELLSYFKRYTKTNKRSASQLNRYSFPDLIGKPKALVQNIPKIKIDLVSTSQ